MDRYGIKRNVVTSFFVVALLIQATVKSECVVFHVMEQYKI